MFGLYISLALLGLSAVDPVGIGIMPVLLAQPKPYKRAFVFLAGSFVSLMVMGLAFAKGLGRIFLQFETYRTWFTPAAEAAGGVVLLAVAIVVCTQLRTGKLTPEPSGRTRRWLRLGNWQLFVLGAALVAVQSIVDVVFVIAMVRAGQYNTSAVLLTGAVAAYAIAALVLQLAVVGAFRLAPARQAKALDAVRKLLAKYANQAVIVVSLVLSLALFTLVLIR